MTRASLSCFLVRLDGSLYFRERSLVGRLMICRVDEHVISPSASSNGTTEEVNLRFLTTFVTWDTRDVFINIGIDFVKGGGKGRGGGSIIVDTQVAKEAI